MQGNQNDSEEFAGNTVRFDRSKWPWPIIAFFSGSRRIDEVQAGARGDPDQKTRAGQVCEAAFYLGAFELGRGANDRALPLLTEAAEILPDGASALCARENRVQTAKRHEEGSRREVTLVRNPNDLR